MTVVDTIVLQIEVGGSLLSVLVYLCIAVFHIPEETSMYQMFQYATLSEVHQHNYSKA